MSAAEIIAELPKLSAGELAQVRSKFKELVEPSPNGSPAKPIVGHPALGIWKDRTDLPDDSVETSHLLRERMMRRTDAAQS